MQYLVYFTKILLLLADQFTNTVKHINDVGVPSPYRYILLGRYGIYSSSQSSLSYCPGRPYVQTF